ncbi:uncharacterized protein LOC116015936 [Ipomoea triloba]|uniref:uncharacterized protein LOC116015936 n=1 Tax=Ipomoea triloba TaxID=35885 RepID=UPI00125D8037|nr:uncharacterized protein LOC116015936 [Ipomoea triloba]
MARDEFKKNPCAEVKIKLLGKRNKDARTYNLPQVSEVATLVFGDLDTNMGQHDILVKTNAGTLQRITELNPSYLPLQYPLLFPYGEDGYTMVEAGRLIYVRTHQKNLRCETYNCLTDALTRGEVDPNAQGRRIILPSSFVGGARYMIQNYQDAMPEVERFLKDTNCRAEDRPDIICRVFKMKLDSLIADCRKNKLFGSVNGVIYTIEFQKRGLPHAHILLCLEKRKEGTITRNLDAIISVEILDKEMDTKYYTTVEEFMMHRPCGKEGMNSPCMSGNVCTKHFPNKFVETSTLDDDGYPIYRRRDTSRIVVKNGIPLDNRYVVPHNRELLLKYRAHINVEWCNQSRSIKYFFKYINKGHDRVTAEFCKSNTDKENGKVVDEINMYYDCRYISPCEAAWRLFGFDIQLRAPSVERLSFHLPGQQSVIFADDDPVENVINMPTIAHIANKTYPEARALTYAEMPTRFVWKIDIRKWTPRKRGFAIGRVFYVPPGTGDIYYLRCLLNKVRGPISFSDLMKVDGVQFGSFKDACYARGLIDDDKEYADAIQEASDWATGSHLRRLFVTLLMSNSIARPDVVWDAVWHLLSEDAQFHVRKNLNMPELLLSEEQQQNFTLLELERLLSPLGKSLKDFPNMPLANEECYNLAANKFIQEELCYNHDAQKVENEVLVSQLTEEQMTIYNEVLQNVDNNTRGLFFVYGYGGTGKTFLWRALPSYLRSKGDIFLNVASSGIASLLLPGWRTAHSRFAIPISINEDSTFNISQ